LPQTIAVGNILELKIYNQQGAQVAVNVCHFQCTAVGGTSLTDNLVALSLGTGVAPLYKAWMPSTAIHLGVRVQIIQPLPVPVYERNVSNAGVGARGADGLAPQLALCTTKRTALAGRQFRGRIYYPFFAEDQSDASGQPLAAAITAADAASAYLFTNKVIAIGADSVSLSPVVYRRQTGVGTPITVYRANEKWATQRRRSLVNKPDNFGP